MRRTLPALALAALAPLALPGAAGAAVPATFSSEGTFSAASLTAVGYYKKSTGALSRLDLSATQTGQLSLATLPAEIWHNGVFANGDCTKGLIQATDQTGEGTGTVTASCDRLDESGRGARFTLFYGWSGLTSPNCVAVSENGVRVDSHDSGGTARCLANVSAISLPITKKGAAKGEASWPDVTAGFVATGSPAGTG